MNIPRAGLQWSAIVALGTVAAGVLWVITVQGFLVLVAPTGSWRLPRVSHITVVSVDRDPDSQLTDYVSAKAGESERVLRLLKAEARELRRDDEVWILDNYYEGGLRPDTYRLTATRLLLEYPEPILLLALWGVFRIRQTQARDARKELQRPRTVWKDEFYKRAERFRKEDG